MPFRRISRTQGRLNTLVAWGLSAFVIGTFVLLSAVLYVNLVDGAKRDARSMAAALQQYAVRTVEVGHLVSEGARRYLVHRGHLDGLRYDADAHEQFRRLAANLPPESGIVFVDRDGRVVVWSDEFPASPIDLKDRGWFKAHSENGIDRIVGPSIVSRVTNTKLFIYTEAFRDDKGTFLGVINIGIPSDLIKGAHALPNYGPGVTLTLFRDDGQIVSRNKFPDSLIGKKFEVPDQWRKGAGTTIQRRIIDDVMSVVGYSSIKELDIVAVTSIPMANVLKPLYQTVAFGVPFLAVVLAAMHWALSRMRAQQLENDRSATRMETILEAAHLGAWHWSIRPDHVYVNRRWAEMLGYVPEEIEPNAQAWKMLIHPDDREDVVRSLDDYLQGRSPTFQGEYRLRHKDGHWVWIFDSGRVVERDAQGAPLVMSGIHLDISSRKTSEERQAVLMAEVDHRAKNTLAVVQALVNLTRAKNVDDLRKGLLGRVTAMAAAHGLLAKSRWEGVDLHDLVDAELLAFSCSDTARVEINGPPVRLSPAAAEALALTFHEMATNAAKHGALRGHGGRMSLQWIEEPDLRVVWREVNAHPTSPPERIGFGSQLIQQTVVHQLGGSVDQEWAPTGLVCTIVVPSRHLLPATARPVVEDATPALPPNVLADANSHAVGTILVVEDNGLLALALQETLVDLGYDVLGPVGTVAAALDLLNVHSPGAAVLDVNVAGERVFPVAEALIKRGIPFLFATGYEDEATLGDYAGAPVLRKPYEPAMLQHALGSLLEPKSLSA